MKLKIFCTFMIAVILFLGCGCNNTDAEAPDETTKFYMEGDFPPGRFKELSDFYLYVENGNSKDETVYKEELTYSYLRTFSDVNKVALIKLEDLAPKVPTDKFFKVTLLTEDRYAYTLENWTDIDITYDPEKYGTNCWDTDDTVLWEDGTNAFDPEKIDKTMYLKEVNGIVIGRMATVSTAARKNEYVFETHLNGYRIQIRFDFDSSLSGADVLNDSEHSWELNFFDNEKLPQSIAELSGSIPNN